MHESLANYHNCKLLDIRLMSWHLLKLHIKAATFIQVLSGFGTFYGPISGILVADFWIVRKRLIKMRDLYIGNEGSIYWYNSG